MDGSYSPDPKLYGLTSEEERLESTVPHVSSSMYQENHETHVEKPKWLLRFRGCA